MSTTMSVNGGESKYVDEDDVATILVSDETAPALVLIGVEKRQGKVDGIIQKDGEKIKFTQKAGGRGKALAAIAEDFTPPAWSCGYSPDIERRSLFESDHHDDHDPSDYDHSAQNHTDHSHQFDPSDTVLAMVDIQHSLRGSEIRIGKRRRAQAISFAFWVDIYIEIDRELCGDKGEITLCDAGTIGPNTLNYVNALFTGANTIYETEIDTHLNVLHIDLNANYATATSTSDALATMRTIYSRPYGGPFHYTSPEGIQPDLHHALLSKSLGGGIAYKGVLCRADYGFGLSGSLSGSYWSMSNAVVWDMMVFMHEVGHNFNSGHTHDGGYSPQIDTCGIMCPAQLPLAKSSTIMSYCHLCSGGYANMDYTFGGKYIGSGDRSSIASYTNTPLAGTVTTEARQVNVVMWAHVSSLGVCTMPYPTQPPTPAPSATPTKSPTRSPTPKPVLTMPPSRVPTRTPTTCTIKGGTCSSRATCCSNSCVKKKKKFVCA
ncbi:hypothetical protein ACHAXA_006454 [Cyclostephanos tholiformis]|uniref:Peptidase M12B domain-containing protein n=1 Tax=Cyclostephanos tholiformis TaxID=382380 RepID=A0ABD3SF18_9STRA